MSDFQQQFDQPATPQVTCWRCRKSIPQDVAKCPFCAARQTAAEAGSEPRLQGTPSTEVRQFRYVLVAFGLILASSIGLTAVQAVAGDAATASEQTRLVRIGVLEAIDVLIILVALVLTRQAVSTTPVRHGRGFLLLVPMLALAMAINFGYHAVLNDFLEIEEAEGFSPSKELLAWWVVVICLQPAIFEELFFRGIAFRSFHRVMGGQGTVLVTSVMFGMAHIYSPLSIPVLVALGIILGYVRLWSGSLIVPILIHLVHNAIVLAVQLQA